MAFTHFINGTSPATGAAALWSVIQMWVAAGASVLGDSDGTTYNATGGQVTSGASGAGGLGNTSAWARVRFPNNREITIQRGTSNLFWRVKYSAKSHFVGGSPSATQTPTAADGVIRFGGGTDASPTYNSWFSNDTTYLLYAGFSLTEGWWFATKIIVGGAASAGAYLDILGASAVGDLDPATFHIATTSSPFAKVTLASGTAALTGGGTYGWLNYGGGAASYVATPALVVGDSAGDVWPNNAGTNPNTSKDQLRLIEYGRKTGAGTTGPKGISSFVAWLSATRSAGETFTISTTRDRIAFGVVSFPWNGAVVL